MPGAPEEHRAGIKYPGERQNCQPKERRAKNEQRLKEKRLRSQVMDRRRAGDSSDRMIHFRFHEVNIRAPKGVATPKSFSDSIVIVPSFAFSRSITGKNPGLERGKLWAQARRSFGLNRGHPLRLRRTHLGGGLLHFRLLLLSRFARHNEQDGHAHVACVVPFRHPQALIGGFLVFVDHHIHLGPGSGRYCRLSRVARAATAQLKGKDDGEKERSEDGWFHELDFWRKGRA